MSFIGEADFYLLTLLARAELSSEGVKPMPAVVSMDLLMGEISLPRPDRLSERSFAE